MYCRNITNMEEMQSFFAEKGLLSYFEQAKKYVKNAIRIAFEPSDDSDIAIGASKFGGCPDLPDDVEWFADEMAGIPLSFICQINFAEVKPYDSDDKLPSSGMLYFFYDCLEMPWGYDPTDGVGKKVFYYDGDLSKLERKAVPDNFDEDAALFFGAAKLTFDNVLELPDEFSSPGGRIKVTDEEESALDEILSECEDEMVINKLLGHSDNIQGEMELECELVTNGLYCGDSSGFNEGRERGIDQNTDHWNLLLQIDSNDEIGMEWGDCGRLYLWITDEDLADRNFEDAWLILQCC